ncbi:hypothetical protein PPNSA23_09940 [Phyllobacterium phragmitis]|uniref:Uncharacterized protein n=1 Tax=Phyllobacterium phragmitis TaxID=2670329 RepID=A0ABQ0GWK6_9HYPH
MVGLAAGAAGEPVAAQQAEHRAAMADLAVAPAPAWGKTAVVSQAPATAVAQRRRAEERATVVVVPALVARSSSRTADLLSSAAKAVFPADKLQVVQAAAVTLPAQVYRAWALARGFS